MTVAQSGEARPRSLTVAVLLAYLIGILGMVSAVIVLTDASDNADQFLRDHPASSRTVALAGSYLLAGGVAVISVLSAVAGRALRLGSRWAWVILIVLSGVGLLGVFSVRSLLGALAIVPAVALLACLLLPATRAFVAEHVRGSERSDTSLPW